MTSHADGYCVGYWPASFGYVQNCVDTLDTAPHGWMTYVRPASSVAFMSTANDDRSTPPYPHVAAVAAGGAAIGVTAAVPVRHARDVYSVNVYVQADTDTE